MFDKKIIQRFFEGKASKIDIESIADYIYSESAENDLQEILDEEFSNASYSPDFDRKANFALIQKKALSSLANASHKKHSFLSRLYKTAAIFIILFGFVALFMILKNLRTGEDWIIESPIVIVKSTEKGQKLHMTLPDGSKVILNALSSIEYPENFEAGIRSVKMTGEAFFEVKKDTLSPFVVSFGQSQISVLGTSFNINNRDINNTTVALVEGRICLQGNDGCKELANPGEMIRIADGEIQVLPFDYLSIISWKDGWLNFENENFTKLKNRLEMWYGVEIEVNGTPNPNNHYTGRYLNKSLEEILQGISYVMKFEYQINDSKVILKF